MLPFPCQFHLRGQRGWRWVNEEQFQMNTQDYTGSIWGSFDAHSPSVLLDFSEMTLDALWTMQRDQESFFRIILFICFWSSSHETSTTNRINYSPAFRILCSEREESGPLALTLRIALCAWCIIIIVAQALNWMWKWIAAGINVPTAALVLFDASVSPFGGIFLNNCRLFFNTEHTHSTLGNFRSLWLRLTSTQHTVEPYVKMRLYATVQTRWPS